MHNKQTQKQRLCISLFVIILVFTAAGLYDARVSAHTDPSHVEVTEPLPLALTEETKRTPEEAREAAKKRVEESRETGKKRSEAAREEAKLRLQIHKERISQKLDAKRKDRCAAREERINRIITKASEQSQKHLSTLQSIESKVTVFLIEKQLTVANYETLQSVVDEKEAAAITALEASRSAILDCDAEGAARELGTHARSSVNGLYESLRAYRTAIKELVVAVRQSHDSAKPVPGQETPDAGEGR